MTRTLVKRRAIERPEFYAQLATISWRIASARSPASVPCGSRSLIDSRMLFLPAPKRSTSRYVSRYGELFQIPSGPFAHGRGDVGPAHVLVDDQVQVALDGREGRQSLVLRDELGELVEHGQLQFGDGRAAAQVEAAQSVAADFAQKAQPFAIDQSPPECVSSSSPLGGRWHDREHRLPIQPRQDRLDHPFERSKVAAAGDGQHPLFVGQCPARGR